MTNAPTPRLVIDFDKPGSPSPQDATRCDFLVIAESQKRPSLVAPLELKRGKLHADQVVRQLQAGARAAERLVCADEAVRFRPVAATGSKTKHEFNKLKNRQNWIRFHRQAEPIRLMSCGAALNQALGT